MTQLSTFLRGAAAAGLLLTAPALHAQQVAFPGAEGAGKFTRGGRGTATAPTTVFEVTSLSDAAGAANTPGTLRYAVTAPAASRTIVFRVCGTIHLTSRLSLNKANTTIAGQTAPGQGICIADHPVAISANNLIIRFLRIRLGDRFQKIVDANGNPVPGSGDGDALSGTGYKNIVVDHCTMSWSNDEAFTVYSGDSTTLQWNLISEPLNYSYHFEAGDTDYQRHGYGGIWGGQRASFHHNLFAHCLNRTPRFNGSRYVNQVNWENCDFRNNVIYNWGSNNVYGGEGGNYNVAGNYYKYGPNTSNSARFRILNPYKQSSPALPYGKFYFTGNYVDGSPTVTNRNWLGAAMNGGTAADTAVARVTTPFPLIPIPAQTAQQAYAAVLQNVGCVLPARDTLDQRIINNVVNRTGRIIDVQGGYPHGTPYSVSQTAWPALTCGPAPADTDHDGMPDAWEVQNGLDPNNAADRQNVAANGYTNLENYLNGIVATVMSSKADRAAASVALQAYPNPATEQLTLQHPVASRAARVTVYGFNGQVVASYAAAAGHTETRLPLAGLPAGNYLLLFADEQLRLTTNIVKR